MGRKCLVTGNVGVGVLGLVSTVTTGEGEGTEDVGEQGSPKAQVKTQSEEEEPSVALMAIGRQDVEPTDHTLASSPLSFRHN